MSSTYSNDLRIELIGTGDQAGVWGVTTNNNLGTLLESAIAGYTSVSVFAVSGKQAFTVENGAADQARFAAIALTTTTGADFSVYAPPTPKLYIIYNASSYTATIYNSTVAGNTTAAGTGVAIPAGKTAAVWTEGTNFALQTTFLKDATLTTPSLSGETFSVVTAVAAGTNAQGQGALTGDVSVITSSAANPGGVTLPTATVGRRIYVINDSTTAVNVYPASGASIDRLSTNASIQIPTLGWLEFNASSTTAWYSSAFGDTGSGANVRATSPTLATPTFTTPVLGTPSSGTLTNCDGLPIVNGTTGTLSVGRGGTGVTTSTGTGNVVLSADPTLSGAATTTGTFAATGASSLIGYGGSAHGSVSQTVSLNFTIDRPSFSVTTNSGTSYANGASFTYTVTNALVTATSNILITDTTAWGVSYSVWRVEPFAVTAGSFKIRMTNVSGSTQNAGMTFNVMVLS